MKYVCFVNPKYLQKRENLAKECSEMRVIDLSISILYDINFQENVAEIWTKKFVQGKMK